MRLTLSDASPAAVTSDALVVGVLETDTGPALTPEAAGVDAAFNGELAALVGHLGVTGTADEVLPLPTLGRIGARMVVVVGLGRPVGDGSASAAGVRRAAGVAARSGVRAASVALALPASRPELVAAATEGWLLGGYRFDRRGRRRPPASAPRRVTVLAPTSRRRSTRAAFRDAQLMAAAISQARDWVNLPPGEFSPELAAAAVRRRHDELTAQGVGDLHLRVRDDVELSALGCGGIIGVGRGSSAPPRLVEISYRPERQVRHLALVGKGITFDSGGLSLKDSAAMTTMKCDMAGAAAVVQATYAIAQLRLPVRVSAFAPFAENMPSGHALRPGDVLTMLDGQTVEIHDTDAEGRLVLADALVRACEENPDIVVDIATLTGHMVTALGQQMGGVLGSPDVVDQVLAAAARADEELWPMPIPDHMVDRIRATTVADLLQRDGRPGGGPYAAAFLREFTQGRPWAHVDMAGPAFHTTEATGVTLPGGTGFGVATLVELARALGDLSEDPGPGA